MSDTPTVCPSCGTCGGHGLSCPAATREARIALAAPIKRNPGLSEDEAARRQSARNKAQSRATAALRQKHAAEYRTLYEVALADLLAAVRGE